MYLHRLISDVRAQWILLEMTIQKKNGKIGFKKRLRNSKKGYIPQANLVQMRCKQLINKWIQYADLMNRWLSNIILQCFILQVA